MAKRLQGAKPDSKHQETEPETASGDYRGPYGYGHAAYKPDPAATYTFKPDTIRPLPLNAKVRWR